MAEPASDLPLSMSVSERKQNSANIFRKAKQEAEAVLESAREHTDELIKDIEESTGGITAPNLLKAAKKEMKAALRKGRTRLLHKLARGNNKGSGDSTDDVEEESETSDDEEEETPDGTMALDSETAETGDKKHQQIESEKEEIKGIIHHDHHATGTTQATESTKEGIDAKAQHEKSDDHHIKQGKEGTEAAELGREEPAEEKSSQPLQRKWGFMQCVGELLERACSPK